MPKEVIMYNLAGNVSEEEYAKYTHTKKGPFFTGLPSVKSFTLLKIKNSNTGKIPFQYMGIVDVASAEEWGKVLASGAFGDFLKEWMPKVTDVQIISGEEIFQGGNGSK